MDGKPQKDVRRGQQQQSHRSGGGGGGGGRGHQGSDPRRAHRADFEAAQKRGKKQTNPHEAEESAVNEAEAQAQSAGVHHQHVINTGLSADADVAHGQMQQRATATAGDSDAAVAEPAAPNPAMIKRPVPRTYVSDPNSPAEVGVHDC